MIKILSATSVALVFSAAIYTPLASAHSIDAKDAAWGLGGIMAGSLYSDSKKPKPQTQYYTEAVPVTVTPARVTSGMTPEQKIQQLNKLAAGGYITPAEYKAEKQAVLDSITD
ncbi:MAG: hypothetical protein AAGI44_17650 [Pseudomonadota bacterium]